MNNEDGELNEASPDEPPTRKPAWADDLSEDEEPKANASITVEDEEQATPPPPPPVSIPIPWEDSLPPCRSVDVYERMARLGGGTYGTVYKAREKSTGEIVALKRIKMEQEREGFPVTALREVKLLLQRSHPNVVNVREVVVGTDLNKVYIAMEYGGSDLCSFLDRMHKKHNTSFTPAEVKCLMQQLLMGVEHLHNNWASNLLYTPTGTLKLADFGMAREYGSPLHPYTIPVITQWSVSSPPTRSDWASLPAAPPRSISRLPMDDLDGTRPSPFALRLDSCPPPPPAPRYRPPELLLGLRKYTAAVDMWSVGCLFAEFITGEPLFPGKGELDQLTKIFGLLGAPDERRWPGYSKLPDAGRWPSRARPTRPTCSGASSPGILSNYGLDLMLSLLALATGRPAPPPSPSPASRPPPSPPSGGSPDQAERAQWQQASQHGLDPASMRALGLPPPPASPAEPTAHKRAAPASSPAPVRSPRRERRSRAHSPGSPPSPPSRTRSAILPPTGSAAPPAPPQRAATLRESRPARRR
ncbi:putative Cyclin-dependent kinase G-2 [Paratrimastix pyriformis]|uniref:Cyclin-dependent kinase G-2 n=1 Tax=Paratrimastix pyriformis TaxID=342808 RepID=A0ABQ8UW29_9EUKA|nr:putative Cyclin-dependent kinase G-2 [Paratrimastix pyriformis]